MKQINIQYYKKNNIDIMLGSFDGKLCLLDFRKKRVQKTIDRRLIIGLGAEYVENDDSVISNTRRQLDEYFEGVRDYFDVPLLVVGTKFQKSVWNALQKVPYGTTSTYLKIAKYIRNEKAVRAVANASAANAIAIIIPCHRIIGSNGTLVGYAGGLPLKRKLLKLEKSI